VLSELDKYLTQIKDPYERRARLLPGLLVIVPLIVALAGRFGARHPVLIATASVIGSCGGMYALPSIVRGRGKALEDQLTAAWGGMPTTIALRHRDPFLDSISKRRYHELITRKLGIAMPTPEEEAADPAAADDVYVGATKRLRELTRGNKGLVFKENIAYGFHRNMLAMKPAGVVICLVVILYATMQTGVLSAHPPFLELDKLKGLGLAAGLSLVVAAGFLVAWLFHFRRSVVRRIGFVYAERLFECLPSLKAAGPRS